MINGVIVEHVQQRLLDLGYSVGQHGADGFYGSDTEAGVKLFQKEKGLKVDGWVGRDTWKVLFNSMSNP
ncbi:peptidoglycan-binding protein [Chrysosporum bergii ANA360D]|uniref:Peptidoglycan-binding protein n=1 Tax=Chrysosporum bergii ANA360D TaxID=617107 RepID=A0AA43GRB6_9CYAN|nr:peptidoglycan-binding domain-containing protein [Chrysosporum bergii]MDH6060190.1 peptidoglycan-binding protein [Chrysosporum bergii ANA360D]